MWIRMTNIALILRKRREEFSAELHFSPKMSEGPHPLIQRSGKSNNVFVEMYSLGATM